MTQTSTISSPSVTMLLRVMILRTTLARTAMLCLLSHPMTLTRCSWLVSSKWLVRMLLLDRISPTSSPSATAPLLVVRQLRVLAEACLVVAVVVVLLVVVLSDVGQVPRPKVAMLRWVRTSRPIDHQTRSPKWCLSLCCQYCRSSSSDGRQSLRRHAPES